MKCGGSDQAGTERCVYGAETAILLTTLVSGDTFMAAKVQFT
ncbi:hypothetical protein BIFGAL_03476 [Bifidobacterium gallicum DSM 20093 = LMG 11596]|uniref:Uncharacterized protein n=1 Tax=Bifidobacterium gallicum DSM 20093 = LMG 11596 TaxID=561180 RepID=D1NUF3_9BIFI|nr:hypothetical protein BIFGAL_03476 [Bifidobacterium gallicum DSM 20093 = LMG 11596]